MQRMIFAVTLGLMASLAFAQESAMAKDGAETTTAAVERKDTKDELKAPPGFRTKKLGGKVLYCNKDSTVGSRFKTEKCYDEGQLKAYLLAREQNNRDLNQSRSICTSCATP